jgi:hypothetical protein
MAMSDDGMRCPGQETAFLSGLIIASAAKGNLGNFASSNLP